MPIATARHRVTKTIVRLFMADRLPQDPRKIDIENLQHTFGFSSIFAAGRATVRARAKIRHRLREMRLSAHAAENGRRKPRRKLRAILLGQSARPQSIASSLLLLLHNEPRRDERRLLHARLSSSSQYADPYSR